MPTLTVDPAFRPAFAPLFREGMPRFGVIVAHRRAGKTVASLQRLLAASLSCRLPSPRYGFLAPFRTQAKTIAWDMLKQMTANIPRAVPHEGELRVDLPNGSRVRLFGADNIDAMRGGYLDGVVLDEHAQMDPDVWDKVVRPMLSDRLGWAQFIGTPAGKNEFYRLFTQAGGDPEWFRLELRASQTGIIPDTELAALKRTMTPEAYAQEYECSFTAATRGAFYGELMERAEKDGRVTDVPYRPDLPCVSAWDLGVRDATAIWTLQPGPGGALYAIDFTESSGVGLPWYVNELRSKPYTYTDHIAPPDIEVTEFGSGRSRREIAMGLGVDFRACHQHKVLEGIDAVRMLLPRMYFDRTRCQRGIEALGLYRQEWDSKLQNFKPVPLHDWTSHAADALRYFAMSDSPDSRSGTGYDYPSDLPINLKHRREPDYSRGYRRSAR